MRAKIGPLTVNRFFDFILPLFFGPYIIYLFNSKGRKILKVVITIFFSITVLSTFYRTIYVSIALSLITTLLLYVKNYSLYKSLILYLIPLCAIIFFGTNYFLPDLDLINIILKRIISLSPSNIINDLSFINRLNQIKFDQINPLIILFGQGFGGVAGQGIPLYTTSNYFIQILLIFGILGLLVFIFPFYSSLKKTFHYQKYFNNNTKIIFGSFF